MTTLRERWVRRLRMRQARHLRRLHQKGSLSVNDVRHRLALPPVSAEEMATALCVQMGVMSVIEAKERLGSNASS